MSITDELREWAAGAKPAVIDGCEISVGPMTVGRRSALTAIADRIDAALEDYIELPKDADGVPIRIGDRIEYNTGGRDTVRFLTLIRDGWAVNERGWKGETMRHVQPDSWERIIEDAQEDGIRYHNEGRPSDFFALVERCKRLAKFADSTKKNVGEEA